MLSSVRQLFGSNAKRADAPGPEIRLATVDDWWRLTRDFPKFRKGSQALLKNYGYMAICEHIQRYKPHRILEFGHGFNFTLLEMFQYDHEVWGIDDFCHRPYFNDKEKWEERYQERIVSKCPKARLIRGLVGKTGPGVLPENYFDVVCSVSVLEEVSRGVLEEVLRHVHKLLRPGGMAVNVIDWRLNNPKRYRNYVEAHWTAGFNLGTKSALPPRFEIHDALLENPGTVMLDFQGDRTEERRYRGHYGTFLMKATRRCD